MKYFFRSVLVPSQVLAFQVLFITLLLTAYGCGDASNDAAMGSADGGKTVFVPSDDSASYEYDVKMVSVQHLEQDDNTITQRLKGGGTMTLIKGEANDDGVLWKSESLMQLTASMDGEEIGKDSQRQEMIYTVSPEGKVVDLKVEGVDKKVSAELQQLLQRSAGGQTGMQMFMQDDWLDREVGETWTEHVLDTVSVGADTTAEAGTERAFLVLDITTNYTYQGEVDTLGYRTARIRYRIKEMKMNGSVVSQGNEMTIDSDASGSGVFYYNLEDRLQVSTLTMANVNMVVGMPSLDSYMPMKQEMTVMMTRK